MLYLLQNSISSKRKSILNLKNLTLQAFNDVIFHISIWNFDTQVHVKYYI